MDTALLTDASTNAALGVIRPAESNAPSEVQSHQVNRVFVSSGSARTWLVSQSSAGAAISTYPLVFSQGQSRPLSEPESLEFAALQRAAENKDHRTFAQLVKAMQWWNREPSDLTRTIDLALAMDMIPLARQLAEQGRILFPSDKRIRQLAAVVAPPMVLGTRESQLGGLESSQQWLRECASKYRNQWIAVQSGRFLGAAPTLKNLHEKIGLAGKTPNTIIVKVLPNGTV